MKMKSFIIFACFSIVSLLIYYFFIAPFFPGPVGGWEILKAKIESKYGYNEQVKLAALQLGEAYQKAIDNPNDTRGLKPLDDGMACIYGVLVSQGIDAEIAINSWSDIRDLVITTYQQQRRWIRFNGGLSGGTYPSLDDDIAKCHFVIER